ncbi:MAG: hypothetical protein JKY08_05040 [Flavobacteriaceae bacterium]|nr:hypothetical protein [Flavobacteriaceae bacterium]
MKKISCYLLVLYGASIWAQGIVNSQVIAPGNYQARLVELDKKERPLFVDFVEKAGIYHQIGHYNKAIFNYKKALEMNPSDVIDIQLAKSYHAAGMSKNAIFIYENVFVKDSSNLLVANQLARLYNSTRQKMHAFKMYNYLKQKDQTNPSYSYQMGRILKKQGNVFTSGELFLDAFRRDSAHVKSIFELAKFYKRLKFKDSTQLFIDKGLALNKESLNFLQLKASFLYTSKKYKESIQYCNTLDSLQFSNAAVNSLKGACFEKMNQLDSAQVYFGKAVKMDRESFEYAYKLATIYYKRKKVKRAKSVLLGSLYGARLNLSAPQFLLGTILQEEGKLKEAIVYFKKSYRSGKRFYKGLFQWAVTAESYYKDKNTALRLYEIYLERFESRDVVLTNYAKQRLKIIRKKMFLEGEITDEI